MTEWSLYLPFGDAFESGWANRHPWLHLLFIQWPICLAPALFTLFLPRLLGYRPGGMAWLGAFVSLLLSLVLPCQFFSPFWAGVYAQLHPWMYGVFYLYALAGMALCGVGLYDRKRSAVWALLAVVSLAVGAMHDTGVWLNAWSGQPQVPLGFACFAFCLVTGFVRRRADPPQSPDIRSSAETLANNRTRRSRSISRRLLREGELHWLPLYGLLLQSDMAREGIHFSGSYRFADHIYRSIPSGRGAFGLWLDGRFLSLAATKAFRLRYIQAQEAMQTAFEQKRDARRFRILAIPCGLPRDFKEWTGRLKQRHPEALKGIEYVGMDLDSDLLRQAAAMCLDSGAESLKFVQGNALIAEDYPGGEFDLIVSTGLGEFLKDEELEIFYRNVHSALAEGGFFYTSATAYEEKSESFMRIFELMTHYRTSRDLKPILTKLPWAGCTLTTDDTGLQTFVLVRKERRASA